jgi:hypothetical protein
MIDDEGNTTTGKREKNRHNSLQKEEKRGKQRLKKTLQNAVPVRNHGLNVEKK